MCFEAFIVHFFMPLHWLAWFGFSSHSFIFFSSCGKSKIQFFERKNIYNGMDCLKWWLILLYCRIFVCIDSNDSIRLQLKNSNHVFFVPMFTMWVWENGEVLMNCSFHFFLFFFVHIRFYIFISLSLTSSFFGFLFCSPFHLNSFEPFSVLFRFDFHFHFGRMVW